jgi:hypothetical protein
VEGGAGRVMAGIAARLSWSSRIASSGLIVLGVSGIAGGGSCPEMNLSRSPACLPIFNPNFDACSRRN